MIDFTHTPKYKMFKHLQTFFSWWLEAFPTASEKAAYVSEILIANVIPCFGLRLSLQSDNRPTLIYYITLKDSQTLNTASYTPLSSTVLRKFEQIEQAIY